MWYGHSITGATSTAYLHVSESFGTAYFSRTFGPLAVRIGDSFGVSPTAPFHEAFAEHVACSGLRSSQKRDEAQNFEGAGVTA